jgi:hypothetical protein
MEELRRWPTGFTLFAGIMMITIGILHALWGLAEIVNDKFFVVGPNYTYDVDVSTWGWIQLVVGVIIGLAGFLLLSGATWARGFVVGLAVLSLVLNFMAIPYFPAWAIVIIALDLAAIWALTVHRWDIKEPDRTGER